MPAIDLRLNGDSALKGETILHHDLNGFMLTALEKGMVGGRTSVAVSVKTPQGWVVAEASLSQLQIAVDALTVKFGREDQ